MSYTMTSTTSSGNYKIVWQVTGVEARNNVVDVPKFQPFSFKIDNAKIRGFDRKDLEWSEHFLKRIRTPGAKRRWRLDNPMDRDPKRFALESMAFKRLKLHKREGVFVDAGCGESPDGDLALQAGFTKAYGFDIFPIKSKPEARFRKHDVCRKFPLPDNSVDAICSNWVVPLMSPEDRKKFYANSFRALKTGGIIVVTGGAMASGWGGYWSGFKLINERVRLANAGFEIVEYGGGVVAKKPPHPIKTKPTKEDER